MLQLGLPGTQFSGAVPTANRKMRACKFPSSPEVAAQKKRGGAEGERLVGPVFERNVCSVQNMFDWGPKASQPSLTNERYTHASVVFREGPNEEGRTVKWSTDKGNASSSALCGMLIRRLCVQLNASCGCV